MDQKVARETSGRTLVAMSGGVDSSVVAALLKDRGEDVVGVSMRLYDAGTQAIRGCCSPDDLFDAREVAAEIGVPFYVVNYQEAFKARIIDYFVDEYRNGRTPSPCVLCNDHLKFDALFAHMEALGGERLATGHYARIEEVEPGRFALLRGVDPIKDQSYFLFGIRRDDLARVRFPLGGMTKDEVRALATSLEVPTATKRESQDLCFVTGSYADFVAARLQDHEVIRGHFKRVGDGEVLGDHDGIHRYTVGQRRGLGVAYSEPLYVSRIDATTGDIWLATKAQLGHRRFEIDRCNWHRWPEAPATFEATVKIRSRHGAVPCHARVVGDGRVEVTLKSPDRAITPGQAAVFYAGDEVLGGGWILRVLGDPKEGTP